MGLDTVELVMAFEEEFEIEIPDAVAEGMVTVGLAADWIADELARRGRPADPGDVFERVRRRTADQTNIDPAKIMRDSRFIEDLRMD